MIISRVIFTIFGWNAWSFDFLPLGIPSARSLSLSLFLLHGGAIIPEAVKKEKRARPPTKDRLLTRLNDSVQGYVSVGCRWQGGADDRDGEEEIRKRGEDWVGEEEIRKRGRRRIGGEIACFFLLLFVEFINKRHVKDAGRYQGSRPVTLICCASHNESRKLVQRARYYSKGRDGWCADRRRCRFPLLAAS